MEVTSDRQARDTLFLCRKFETGIDFSQTATKHQKGVCPTPETVRDKRRVYDVCTIVKLSPTFF